MRPSSNSYTAIIPCSHSVFIFCAMFSLVLYRKDSTSYRLCLHPWKYFWKHCWYHFQTGLPCNLSFSIISTLSETIFLEDPDVSTSFVCQTSGSSVGQSWRPRELSGSGTSLWRPWVSAPRATLVFCPQCLSVQCLCIMTTQSLLVVSYWAPPLSISSL